MCRSCLIPYNGKYLQQCDFCGHPKHEGNHCGVGTVRNIPIIIKEYPVSIGCLCKEKRYD